MGSQLRVKIFVSTLVILMLYLIICTREVNASSNKQVSFQGNVGLIIDLTFPEEAHPTDPITYNLTLTATTSVFWFNVTLIVEAFVDTDWQQIHIEAIPSKTMLQDDKYENQITFNLSEGTHERLYCYVYVLTNTYVSSGEASTTFYTTYIRSPTYDELLDQYSEALINYSSLLADYHTLIESYETFSTQYNNLNSTYISLLSQYNSLLTSYSSLNSSYYSQNESYSELEFDYNSLLTSYNSLNDTYNELNAEDNNLKEIINTQNSELNLTQNLMYVFIALTSILILLSLYIKMKKPLVVYTQK